jgi:hypothetical protein
MLAKQNGRNRLYICQCEPGSEEAAALDGCRPFSLAAG